MYTGIMKQADLTLSCCSQNGRVTPQIAPFWGILTKIPQITINSTNFKEIVLKILKCDLQEQYLTFRWEGDQFLLTYDL